MILVIKTEIRLFIAGILNSAGILSFLVGDINKELVSLERQMDNIIVKSKIPKEQGEEDFLKMLDTTRAIPNAVAIPIQAQNIDKKIPKVE